MERVFFMKKLLVVDLQWQFQDEGAVKYNKCLNFVKENMSKFDHTVATLFKQSKDNMNYVRHLQYSDCMDTTVEDLAYYSEPFKGTVLVKHGYGTPELSQYISKDDEVTVVGCDTDASVLAFCFQLWDMGVNFEVLTDYVYTTSTNKAVIDGSIEIMKRNFGDCIK